MAKKYEAQAINFVKTEVSFLCQDSSLSVMVCFI
jgi:hypothetical protein